MPSPAKFAAGFGFRKGKIYGENKDNLRHQSKHEWKLTNIQIKHNMIQKYEKYEFPIKLTFTQTKNKSTSGLKLVHLIQSETKKPKVILSDYGNPYLCYVSHITVTLLNKTNQVIIHALGTATKIHEKDKKKKKEGGERNKEKPFWLLKQYYINFAWGFQHKGFWIDRKGNVYQFELKNQDDDILKHSFLKGKIETTEWVELWLPMIFKMHQQSLKEIQQRTIKKDYGTRDSGGLTTELDNIILRSSGNEEIYLNINEAKELSQMMNYVGKQIKAFG